jgi:hypothetical protein
MWYNSIPHGCRRQRAEGRGQKAEGRGQEAESRRQRAGGRGQRAEGEGRRRGQKERAKVIVVTCVSFTQKRVCRGLIGWL